MRESLFIVADVTRGKKSLKIRLIGCMIPCAVTSVTILRPLEEYERWKNWKKTSRPLPMDVMHGEDVGPGGT